MISKFELFKRLFTAIIAVLQPFIIYFTCGDLISLSQAWNTPLQPLFIFTNALVSYFFFDLPKWRISAVLLLLLTVFSVENYGSIHNILTILFFGSCIYPLYSIHRFRIYMYGYLLSVLIGLFFGLFWIETFAIVTLCIYHLHLLIHTNKLFRNRPNNF